MFVAMLFDISCCCFFFNAAEALHNQHAVIACHVQRLEPVAAWSYLSLYGNQRNFEEALPTDRAWVHPRKQRVASRNHGLDHFHKTSLLKISTLFLVDDFLDARDFST
jgi:hypothetical protein